MFLIKPSIGQNLFTVRINIYLNQFEMIWIFLEGGNGNLSSEENSSNNENGDVGGLFHVSQRKKINVNDQEDYTLMNQNEKRNWDLDEVWREIFWRYEWIIDFRFVI